MAVAASESISGVPNFSPWEVDLSVLESEGALTDYRHTQLDLMAAHNPSLRAFMVEKTTAFGSRGLVGPSERWVASYVLAHGALRTALSDESALPQRDSARLHSVDSIARDAPVMLGKVVDGDYENHPGMLDFLDALHEANQGSSKGACLMLAVYGLWANPNRPKISIPDAAAPAQPLGNRAGRSRGNNADQPWLNIGVSILGR